MTRDAQFDQLKFRDPVRARALSEALHERIEKMGREVQPAGVPYCSDACWTPHGVPAIILGPGDIAAAHAIDECVDLLQMMQCAELYRQLLMRDWLSDR